MSAITRNVVAGVALGVGAGYAARQMIPALGPVVRPVTKTFMKSAILGYEKVREAFAHVGESIEDLTAEVRSELQREEPALAEAGQKKTKTTRKAGEQEEGARGQAG